MLLLVTAFFGGVLTLLSACILPVLPIVLARAGRPFRSQGLPMLAGMALAFAAAASLAALGGGWIVATHRWARDVALVMLALFGASLLWASLAERLSRPLVALGARRIDAGGGDSALSALVLGIATGLLWTPCAGPILGLILTTAALNGASVGTSLLLLAYAAGAAASLAAALLFGGRLHSALQRVLPSGERLRRAAGAAVLTGIGAVAFGLDTGPLGALAIPGATRLETSLLESLHLSGQAPKSGFVQVSTAEPSPLPIEGRLPSLAGATEWINSPPLTPEALRGKVVLVDFWTYSCINCLRTLPYLRAWAEKYKQAGLVVIGVHAPEFAFEKRSANVHQATQDLGIPFPVAVDSNFAIWRAFGNQYWPAFYFVDAQGRIRHHQFGENDYDASERVIQQLLTEAGRADVARGLVSPQGQGTQTAPARVAALSQESYLGHERADGFASPGGIVRDKAQAYQVPSALRLDQWALSGDWSVGPERALLDRAGGRIAYRFQARDLHLVLGPADDGKPVRFRVRIDGRAPGADHGFDTDAEGIGRIDRQRLYQLVRRSASDGDHLFEIEFLDPGAQAYVFTFG